LQKRTESIHNRLASDITVRDLDALLEGETEELELSLPEKSFIRNTALRAA
jgi:hypothetical protein